MIEPIMYIGIGFLFAGLLVIGVIPLVHARASPIHERVAAQLDGNFRISWQLRRQLSRLVAPYLREKVRPSSVV